MELQIRYNPNAEKYFIFYKKITKRFLRAPLVEWERCSGLSLIPLLPLENYIKRLTIIAKLPIDEYLFCTNTLEEAEKAALEMRQGKRQLNGQMVEHVVNTLIL